MRRGRKSLIDQKKNRRINKKNHVLNTFKEENTKLFGIFSCF